MEDTLLSEHERRSSDIKMDGYFTPRSGERRAHDTDEEEKGNIMSDTSHHWSDEDSDGDAGSYRRYDDLEVGLPNRCVRLCPLQATT